MTNSEISVRKKVVVVVSLACGVALTLGCRPQAPAPDSPPSRASNAAKGRLSSQEGRAHEDQLSHDQTTVLSRYSLPDSFSIMFAGQDWEGRDQPMRLELWNYDQLEVCFRFENGAFAGIAPHAPAQSELPSTAATSRRPTPGPGEFRRSMTLDEINGLTGDIPLTGAEFPEGVLDEEAEFYIYTCGLVVGLIDDQLSFVQFTPLSAEEASE